MNESRPNPDDLLARAEREVAPRRGKLMIFFGYAAGVGKTYAMLEAAHREKAAGVDVVIGYVEPHGRTDTEALIQGIEVLPPKLVPYHGVTLREFDLDAALARRPQLILVDELAHTNAEGLRHTKRWQDVDELLNAGIDVYSTLNVQHVESLNDVIAQITGVVVRETLPDAVVERADDIELVDLTPEELIDRLKEGKVYLPQQAERALQHFFQKANLTALREISLRQVAQRLSKEVDAARQEKAARVPWATNERLLVCVGPSPTSAKLIRTAKRMVTAFGAEWLAVAVERGAVSSATDHRHRVAQHLRLAERLGAEALTLTGTDVAQTLLDFAVTRNVTKIVVGKSLQPRWKKYFVSSVVDALLERSGTIDIYVIRGEPEGPSRPVSTSSSQNIRWSNYLGAGVIVLICGFLGWLSHIAKLTEANTVMVFLLGVAVVAARFGRGPAVAAAIVNVLVFDFFFVPPYLRLSVNDAQYVLTFGVMLIIGVIIGTLTSRMREQLYAIKCIQRRTTALFRLTKQLTEVAGPEFLVRSAGQQLHDIFDGDVVIFLRDQSGPVQVRFGEKTDIAANEVNAATAQWVADHDQSAGLGTDTLPNATARFVPLIGSQQTLGAVGVRSRDPDRFADPEQGRLLETCASLIALSLERDQSVMEASEARLRVQTEEMRNSLLSSVSHDLRTPLAVIAAASSNLLDERQEISKTERREILNSIVDESRHLTRLVENLLDMTRLEAGAVVPNRQWHVIEEIVGSALARTRRDLKHHFVRTHISNNVPLAFIDDVLIGQVLVNLLENAARYTPAGSEIDIHVVQNGNNIEMRILDNGPGLKPGTEANILEKFYRAPPAIGDNRRGAGLGLAICQAIVRAHGGRIVASNRPTGGAEFVITIPNKQSAPAVELDEQPITDQ